MGGDIYHLQRFVDAQQLWYPMAKAELQTGKKRGHWMWFIFPQLAGLAKSVMSQRYAISSQDEAAAYLAHPVLGERLLELCQILLTHQQLSATDIFGTPDDMKLHSSMTLFASVPNAPPIFQAVLQHYFASQPDERTQALLDNGASMQAGLATK